MGASHSKETHHYFLEYGATAVTGRRATQEDRFAVDIQYGSDQVKSFFGVFDGHFGTKAAEFCRDNLAKEIISNPSFDKNPTQAIKTSFANVDSAFLDRSIKKGDKSGTTALAVILINRAVIVSHLGNCRLLACHNNHLLQITKDHKPNRKSERRRIRRLGGRVIKQKLQGRLTVSRALGDFPYKNTTDLSNSLLSNEPDVFVTKLDHNVDYLLLATDGLFEYLSHEEIKDFIAHQRETGEHLQNVVEGLARKAIASGSEDNVTVVLIGFRHKTDVDDITSSSFVYSDDILASQISTVSQYAYDDPDGDSSIMTDSATTLSSTSVSDDSLIPEEFRDEPAMD